jgi:hypothetical protein
MRRKTFHIAAAVAAALAVVAGVALATRGDSVPAPPQAIAAITACVGPEGQPRIVVDADACRGHERGLTWNIAGPKGEVGADRRRRSARSEGRSGRCRSGRSARPARRKR